ncbi:opine metallophore biosynthesis dehydrogenase [Paenibacillus sp. sgz302251]|uniref:opine metallophore biosynthesis dehydrogenase n=1 Tax=Paenibacillus sp. sgz302251 TaxID=3414493 RepID=UPI003C7CBEA8
MARYAGVQCPTIDRFVSRYDQAVQEASARLSGSALSDAFRTQSFELNIVQICAELLPLRTAE